MCVCGYWKNIISIKYILHDCNILMIYFDRMLFQNKK